MYHLKTVCEPKYMFPNLGTTSKNVQTESAFNRQSEHKYTKGKSEYLTENLSFFNHLMLTSAKTYFSLIHYTLQKHSYELTGPKFLHTDFLT